MRSCKKRLLYNNESFPSESLKINFNLTGNPIHFASIPNSFANKLKLSFIFEPNFHIWPQTSFCSNCFTVASHAASDNASPA